MMTKKTFIVLFGILISSVIWTAAFPCDHWVNEETRRDGTTVVIWRSDFHVQDYTLGDTITLKVVWKVKRGMAIFHDFLLKGFTPKSKKDPVEGELIGFRLIHDSEDGEGEIEVDLRFTGLHRVGWHREHWEHKEHGEHRAFGTAHFKLMLKIDRNGDGRFEKVTDYGVDVHVEGREGHGNLPPVVDAGPEQTITLPRGVALNGSVTDDGLPPWGTLSISWTKVSGPGDVFFSDPKAAVTTATFSQAGTYVLRLTGNDSQLSSSDDVSITVDPGNRPPIANAGPDRIIKLGSTQKTVQVTLDGSGSTDPDGLISSYTWTGRPDPEDVSTPSVSLPPGVHTFTLVVTDDKGAPSSSDSVTIRVLGPPIIVPPPKVTNEPMVILKGVSLPGANIILSYGSTEKVENAANGVFEIPMDLSIGLNQIQVFAEIDGLQSESTGASVTYVSTTSLSLENISPQSGQAGSILNLTGSGFTSDKKVMGVYFKGVILGGRGIVLEATGTTMKVIVPFAFVKSEEDLSVYVYDSSQVSNVVSFHVSPPRDRTPDIPGNEMSYQFDLLAIQIQRALTKLEQLTKLRISTERWGLIEGNLHRLEQFVDNFKTQMISIPNADLKSTLDGAFSSDIFLSINQKLEHINERLSHSTDGEAICNINEVIETLNELAEPLGEIEDILDWVIPALYVATAANGVACFFGCVPCCGIAVVIADAIPIVETVNGIVEAILSVIQSIDDIFHAAVPSIPSDWKVIPTGPFSGIDPHLLYTWTENNLSVYANFTNEGFRQLIGQNIAIDIPDPMGAFSIVHAITGIDVEGAIERALGRAAFNFILDLAGVDDITITITDVVVPSTVQRRDPNNFLLSIPDEGSSAELHTLLTWAFVGPVELNVRASCGPYDYPNQTSCKQYLGDVCLEWEQVYPEFYSVEIIDKPSITGFDWHDSDQYWVLDDWTVLGKGFSNVWGTTFKVYWNDEPIWACDLRRNDFSLCGIRKPGWLSVAAVDVNGNERRSSAVFVLPPPDHVAHAWPLSGSAFVDDTGLLAGDIFSSTPADTTIDFIDRNGIGLASIHPEQSWVKSYTLSDMVRFKVPEALYGHEGEEIKLRVKAGPPGTPCNSNNCVETAMTLRFEEGTPLYDQDVMAYGQPNTYLRSAAVADLDGDGENDLIVGIPEARNFGYAMGAVYIAFGPLRCQTLIRGNRTTEILDLADDSCWDLKILGDPRDVHPGGNSRRIGHSLAVGDIDGDGIADLLIGTTDQNELDEHTPNIRINPTSPGHIPGKAYVFYGRSRQEWLGGRNNAIYHTEINGRSSWGYDVKFYGDDDRELGYQVAIGDMKKDLWADIVISAPTDSVNPDSPNQLLARTYVIFGRAVPLMGDIELGNPLNAVRDTTVIEEQNFYQIDIKNFDTAEYVQYKGNGLGKSIAIGDVNGDGVDDLLLGAPQYGRVPGSEQLTLYQGAAYLFYGGFSFYSHTYRAVGMASTGGDQDLLIEGPPVFQVDEKSGFGRSLAMVDLNHDGKGELVFGAPSAKLNYKIREHCLIEVIEPMPVEEPGIGSVYVVSGTNPNLSGWTRIDSLADLTINGSPTLSQFGTAVASADVNGDGIKDLLVGAPGKWGTAANGRVWVMYGNEAPGWLATEGPDVINLLERQWYFDTPEFYEPYEDNLFGCGRSLEDTIYDFTINSDTPATSHANFGSFIAVGDLGPYTGDDLLIINPLATGPPNPSNPSEPPRDYSGMLYIFYKGPQAKLSVSPTSLDFGETDTGGSFTIFNTGIGTMSWNITDDLPGWLHVISPMSGETEAGGTSTSILNVSRHMMVVGNYSHTLTITSNGGSANVQITMTVPGQALFVNPASLDFGSALTDSSFNIENRGNFLLEWSIPTDLFPSWLRVMPTSSNLSPTFSSPVSVHVNRAGLSPGTYQHTIDIGSNGGGASVLVTMVVSEPPFLSVSSTTVDFGETATAGSFTISNTGGGTLSWSISDGLPGWLQVASPMSGETATGTTSTIILNVSRNMLVVGNYSHTLSITSNGGNASVEITMTVPGQALFVNPTSLDFGTTLIESSFNIENRRNFLLEWSIPTTLFPSWLRVMPTSSNLSPTFTATVGVYVNRVGLSPGTYQHTIDIGSNGGGASVLVTMVVPLPVLSVLPGSLNFGTTTTQRSLTISNSGGGTLNWNVTADLPGWLSASLMSGETLSGSPSTVLLNADRNGLAPGAYNHTLSISSNGGTAFVPVTMSVELPLTVQVPYYSCSESYGEKSYVAPGSSGGYATGTLGSMSNTEGISTTLLSSGFRGWCYPGEVACSCDFPVPLNFPGDHPLYMSGSSCSPDYIGWTSTWGSVVADPEAGSMTSLVGGLNHDGPIKTCFGWFGGLTCFPTIPPTWGFGYGYGYMRQVMRVESDGTLQTGAPVEIRANISVEGVFDGDESGSVQALVILNKIENAGWFQNGNNCISWSFVQEGLSHLFPSMLGYKQFRADSATAVDQNNDGLKDFGFEDSINANVNVGDIVVIETFLRSDVSLVNPEFLGESGEKEGWAGEAPDALMSNSNNVTEEGVRTSVREYGNNVQTTLSTTTTGVILVPYTNAP